VDCRFFAASDIVLAFTNCYPEAVMARPLKVVLYGDTLVLAGLQAGLASYAGLEVTGLDGLTAGDQELCAALPDAVIFDLGAAQPAFYYALVEKLPELLLVGVDATCNRALVWCGQQVRELSIHDLVLMIEHQKPHLTSC
jgi:hypothetical protein